MNSLQSWFRGCARTVGLLALLVVLYPFVLGYRLSDALMRVIWRLLPKERGWDDDIIVPVEDHQVPAYLQPIVAIRREAALVRNYRGPIAWYFRGSVTLAEIVAEFGHARVLRKIFGQQLDGIWPKEPMLVFWSPCEVLTERVDGEPKALKNDWGLPCNHAVSRGRALVLYLLLLRYHCLNGRSALPSGSWLQTETYNNSHSVRIGYGDWVGYRIDLRGCADATGYYMLGIEPANNFALKRAA